MKTVSKKRKRDTEIVMKNNQVIGLRIEKESRQGDSNEEQLGDRIEKERAQEYSNEEQLGDRIED